MFSCLGPRVRMSNCLVLQVILVITYVGLVDFLTFTTIHTLQLSLLIHVVRSDFILILGSILKNIPLTVLKYVS
jgi:hypothetical protein